ncbi:MAG: alpha-rhamnosidase, partial [Clostridia bacterium]|nr:alpha-rhamnosidase [Clostridia bacterium]
YWGGMLALGATSIWEQYNPEEGIPECYAMYGDKYQKSLCHAWSCGPIYFLGRYCLGVYPTDVAYKTYKVEPNPGIYNSFKGDVPTEKGNIHVEYDGRVVSVLSEIDGGTLVIGGVEYDIPKGEMVCVKA